MTLSGQVLGTIGYMAPEQARERRELSPSADVFSLGCVLFECLTGRPAFTGDRLMAVLAKVLFADLPRVSEFCDDVAPALDELVLRMMQKVPEDRPTLPVLLGEIEAISRDRRLYERRPRTSAVREAAFRAGRDGRRAALDGGADRGARAREPQGRLEPHPVARADRPGRVRARAGGGAVQGASGDARERHADRGARRARAPPRIWRRAPRASGLAAPQLAGARDGTRHGARRSERGDPDRGRGVARRAAARSRQASRAGHGFAHHPHRPDACGFARRALRHQRRRGEPGARRRAQRGRSGAQAARSPGAVLGPRSRARLLDRSVGRVPGRARGERRGRDGACGLGQVAPRARVRPFDRVREMSPCGGRAPIRSRAARRSRCWPRSCGASSACSRGSRARCAAGRSRRAWGACLPASEVGFVVEFLGEIVGITIPDEARTASRSGREDLALTGSRCGAPGRAWSRRSAAGDPS